MLIYKSGDILTCHADIICQQVNCRGVMGAGLAKQIADKYPTVKQMYEGYCKQNANKPLGLLGKVQYVFIGEGRFVANIFGQLNYGRDVIQTSYAAVRAGLNNIKNCFMCRSIAIPYKMGCGLAGGDWVMVQSIINDIFRDSSNRVEIWQLSEVSADIQNELGEHGSIIQSEDELYV